MRQPKSIAWITAIALGAVVAVLALGAGIQGIDILTRRLLSPLQWSTRVTPAGPVVLTQIQALRRLETTRYRGNVVVRGDTGGPLPRWIAGDRMIFLAQGDAIAGVDLARMKPEDVKVDGDTVTLRLPPAEIFHVNIDNTTSEVFERKAGLFTGPDPSLETNVRIEAEARLREAALESGVLTTANENARAALADQLRALGFRDIRWR